MILPNQCDWGTSQDTRSYRIPARTMLDLNGFGGFLQYIERFKSLLFVWYKLKAPEVLAWRIVVVFSSTYSYRCFHLGSNYLNLPAPDRWLARSIDIGVFFQAINIWVNYKDLNQRPHPRWWLVREIIPKCPNNSDYWIILIYPVTSPSVAR